MPLSHRAIRAVALMLAALVAGSLGVSRFDPAATPPHPQPASAPGTTATAADHPRAMIMRSGSPAPRGVDLHHLPTVAELARTATALRSSVHRPGVATQSAAVAPSAVAPSAVAPSALAPAAVAPSAGGPVAGGTPLIPTLTRHVAPSCTGDGTDGNRVQALYAVERGRPDRFAAVLPYLRGYVADVDDTVASSAALSQGGRRVRWVSDAYCRPRIDPVILPAGSLTAGNAGASFTASVNALHAAGYDDGRRKYLVFADAAVLCGIGQLYSDSRPTGNANDGGWSQVARVDAPCWNSGGTTADRSVPAHELMHTLGAVQGDAPHRSQYGHCTDASDVMCYLDGPGTVLTQRCPVARSWYFDCGGDDYFSASPAAGSYLATHFNTANSTFLDVVGVDRPATVVPRPAPARIATRTTLTASVRAATVRLRGAVSDSAGRPQAGVLVRIYGHGYRAPWRLLATLTTTAGGVFALVRTAPDTLSYYRADTVANSARTASSSAIPHLKAPTVVELTGRAGRPDRFTATLRYAGSRRPMANQALTFYYRMVGAVRWTAQRTVGTNAHGQITFTEQPHHPCMFMVRYVGNARVAGAVSNGVRVSS
jgi:hypothetical protein